MIEYNIFILINKNTIRSIRIALPDVTLSFDFSDYQFY
jgi:hypothetical protein